MTLKMMQALMEMSKKTLQSEIYRESTVRAPVTLL